MSTHYTFCSWLRSGLSNQIRQADTLDSGAHLRAELELRVQLQVGDATQELSRQVALVGPGEVVGLNPRAIARVEPSPGHGDFESNYLPFVEFHDEDLPWRYTPASPSGDRLRPWLTLLTLEEGEFEELPGSQPLPAVQVVDGDGLALDLTQVWAWAHVHVEGTLPDDDDAAAREIEALRSSGSDRLRSRLLSPRRLRPWQRYHALLVPTFEAGRLAGLGQDAQGVPALQPAWEPGAVGVTLPVYHRWTFGTSEATDVETVVRRLAPDPGREIRRPRIGLERLRRQLGVPEFASNFGHLSEHAGPKGRPSVTRRSALMPRGDGTTDFGLVVNQEGGATEAAIRARLAEELNTADDAQQAAGAPPDADPIVDLPPLYGRWHAARSRVDPNSPPGWFEQVNLDPTWRAVAGLGAQIVAERQEELVELAWRQVEAVQEANRRLRTLELSAEVGLKVTQKHLASRSAEAQVAATAPLHGRAALGGAPQALPEAMAETTLPIAAVDPGLVKACRPNAPGVRLLRRRLPASQRARLGHAALLGGLADNSDGLRRTVSAAPPLMSDDHAQVSTAEVTTAAGSAPDPEIIKLLRLVENAKLRDASRDLARSRGDFQRFDEAATAVRSGLGARLRSTAAELAPAGASGGLSPAGMPSTVMAAPTLDLPVYRLLMERDPGLIVPGVEGLAPNSASLLAVDQAFVESALVGMNHAMAAELLWRGYPTDQRGSYFRQFWDSADRQAATGQAAADCRDISPLHAWTSASRLGSHAPSGAGPQITALVLCADLVRRLSEIAFWVQRARWIGPSNALVRARGLAPATPDNLRPPLFRAATGSNVLVLGFELSPEEAVGQGPDPGWFIVLQERPGRLRFGLDLGVPGATWSAVTADALSWEHMAPTPYLSGLGAGDPDQAVALAGASLSWGPGSSAADLASILVRAPVALAIHASSLLA